jgi:hypothetical protein
MRHVQSIIASLILSSAFFTGGRVASLEASENATFQSSYTERGIYTSVKLKNHDYFLYLCEQQGKEKRWDDSEIEKCANEHPLKETEKIAFMLYLKNRDWPTREPYLCALDEKAFIENDRGVFQRAEIISKPEICDLIDDAFMSIAFPCPAPEFFAEAETVSLVINGLNGTSYKWSFNADYVSQTTCGSFKSPNSNNKHKVANSDDVKASERLVVYESLDPEKKGYATVTVKENLHLGLMRNFEKYGGGATISVGIYQIFGMQKGRWICGMTSAPFEENTIIIRDSDGNIVFKEPLPSENDESMLKGAIWPMGETAAKKAWEVAPLGSIEVEGKFGKRVSLNGFKELWEWGVDNADFPILETDPEPSTE